MLKGKVVACDFDGVLNPMQGWKRGEPIPEPRQGAFEFLQTLAERYEAKIIIFTCRDISEVWEWLHYHQMVSFITNVTGSKPPAFAYVDDRAICFRGDFVETLKQIKTFEPHWKNDEKRLWVSTQHDQK